MNHTVLPDLVNRCDLGSIVEYCRHFVAIPGILRNLFGYVILYFRTVFEIFFIYSYHTRTCVRAQSSVIEFISVVFVYLRGSAYLYRGVPCPLIAPIKSCKLLSDHCILAR